MVESLSFERPVVDMYDIRTPRRLYWAVLSKSAPVNSSYKVQFNCCTHVGYPRLSEAGHHILLSGGCSIPLELTLLASTCRGDWLCVVDARRFNDHERVVVAVVRQTYVTYPLTAFWTTNKLQQYLLKRYALKISSRELNVTEGEVDTEGEKIPIV